MALTVLGDALMACQPGRLVALRMVQGDVEKAARQILGQMPGQGPDRRGPLMRFASLAAILPELIEVATPSDGIALGDSAVQKVQHVTNVLVHRTARPPAAQVAKLAPRAANLRLVVELATGAESVQGLGPLMARQEALEAVQGPVVDLDLVLSHRPVPAL